MQIHLDLACSRILYRMLRLRKVFSIRPWPLPSADITSVDKAEKMTTLPGVYV